MKSKIFFITISVIFLFLIIFLMSDKIFTNNKELTVPQVVLPQKNIITPTFTPTPTIVAITSDSNLQQEVDNLDPEDFSPDLETLKKEISNF